MRLGPFLQDSSTSATTQVTISAAYCFDATKHSFFLFAMSLVFGFIMFYHSFQLTAAKPTPVTKEIFRDDFNGAALNAKLWNAAQIQSTINGEKEFYTPAAVNVAGGNLNITGSRAQKTSTGYNYTSGRVDTKGKFQFLYGYVEWRAKLPGGGKGIWPALWMESPNCDPGVSCNDWPPAVVIDFHADLPKSLLFSVYYKDANGVKGPDLQHKYDGNEDLTLNFYTYAILWTRGKVEFFVNGDSIFAVRNQSASPKVSLQLVINLALGGVFGDPDDSTKLPTEMLLDYVSVHEAENANDVATEGSKVPKFLAPLLGVLIPLLVIALGIGVFVYMKINRYKHGSMRKESTVTSGDTRTTGVSNYLTDIVSDYMKGQLAMQHYVNLLEIPLANLEISDVVLGKGEYGVVNRGVAKGLRGCTRPTVVAVKSVKNPNDEEQCRALVEEMKIMTKAGRHLNILNMLGAVVIGETLLLTEYCALGSLGRFLETHRGPYFVNQVDADGTLLPQEDEEIQERQTVIAEQTRRPGELSVADRVVTSRDLIDYAYQISRGMGYLTGRKIIHRDLAARNVLVAEEGDEIIMKVSDFGMARQEDEYVLENQQVALPVRWMPPEAISRRTFTQKSDVWSFGVLLWEMWTLGETPYKNAGLSTYIHDFVKAIAEGFRMSRPMFCPTDVYAIMEKCWQFENEKRPSFGELETQLRALMGPDYSDAYLDLDVPYQQFNVAHQDLLDEVADYNESPEL